MNSIFVMREQRRPGWRDIDPNVVVLAAAKVGGIQANSTYPADFLLDNLKIQNNVIENAWRWGEAVTVSRQQLHLSQVRVPTDPRRIPADRSAGAHQ